MGKGDFCETLFATHKAQFPPPPWPFDKLPMEYVESLIKGVVAFAFEITRLEGKFKMSQNRSERGRVKVSVELRARQDLTLCEVIELVSGARKRG